MDRTYNKKLRLAKSKIKKTSDIINDGVSATILTNHVFAKRSHWTLNDWAKKHKDLKERIRREEDLLKVEKLKIKLAISRKARNQWNSVVNSGKIKTFEVENKEEIKSNLKMSEDFHKEQSLRTDLPKTKTREHDDMFEALEQARKHNLI